MTNPTDLIVTQGRALVGAIDALETMETTNWFECAIARLQLAALLAAWIKRQRD